jgi:hypothetical protein
VTQNVLKEQLVRSLHQIAEDLDDDRQSPACFELCVCYSSDFGISRAGIVDDRESQRTALNWLYKAAKNGGHEWARLAVKPVFDAFEQQIPNDLPVTEWLKQAVQTGSLLALDILGQIDPSLKVANTKLHKQRFCGRSEAPFESFHPSDGEFPTMEKRINKDGDTILHYAAATGQTDLLQEILGQLLDPAAVNCTNYIGETALLQAARTGCLATVNLLVQHNADGMLINNFRESPLHFLNHFDDNDVGSALQSLVRAGAHNRFHTVATDSSANCIHSPWPKGGGTPAHRAMLGGNLVALEALLDFEEQASEIRTTDAGGLGLLLAYAMKLRHVHIIEYLICRTKELQGRFEKFVRIWDNGRLLDHWELGILGAASVNPSCGFNWPEKFARIICFGRGYQAVLRKAFELLASSHWAREPDMYEKYAKMAIQFGRRDASLLMTMRAFFSPFTTGTMPEPSQTALGEGSANKCYSRGNTNVFGSKGEARPDRPLDTAADRSADGNDGGSLLYGIAKEAIFCDEREIFADLILFEANIEMYQSGDHGSALLSFEAESASTAVVVKSMLQENYLSHMFNISRAPVKDLPLA